MRHIGVLACILVMAVTGCSWKQVLTTVGIGAAAAGGAAAVYYVKGDLESDLDHDVNQVYKATMTTVEKRGYTVKENNIADATGRIEAEVPTADGKTDNLTIKLDRKTDALTHISIRVGVFGDEALARSILDDIQSNLT